MIQCFLLQKRSSISISSPGINLFSSDSFRLGLPVVSSMLCCKDDDIAVINESRNKEFSADLSGGPIDIFIDRSQVNEPELTVINFSSVAAATKNFSEANRLGHGGFGTVYKVNFISSTNCRTIMCIVIIIDRIDRNHTYYLRSSPGRATRWTRNSREAAFGTVRARPRRVQK